MAVLDVAIPTGYWIQQQKLDAYILSKRVRNLQRARYQEKKVLFYFDYVSSLVILYLKSFFQWFLFVYSLIKRIFALTLQSNDGTRWQICHGTCQSECTITMLRVSTTETQIILIFSIILVILLQNDLTRRYSTHCQRICWTFARCAAVPSVRTVRFTMQLSSHRYRWCWSLRWALWWHFGTFALHVRIVAGLRGRVIRTSHVYEDVEPLFWCSDEACYKSVDLSEESIDNHRKQLR